jgi:hypothetical protein
MLNPSTSKTSMNDFSLLIYVSTYLSSRYVNFHATKKTVDFLPKLKNNQKYGIFKSVNDLILTKPIYSSNSN